MIELIMGKFSRYNGNKEEVRYMVVEESDMPESRAVFAHPKQLSKTQTGAVVRYLLLKIKRWLWR